MFTFVFTELATRLYNQSNVSTVFNDIHIHDFGLLYTRVNKRNWLRSTYCLLNVYFFHGFCTWIISAILIKRQQCKFSLGKASFYGQVGHSKLLTIK